MWKTTITVVVATASVFATVMAGTVMLIEASTVDLAAMHDRQAPKHCRAPDDLSLPPAPLLLKQISAMPDVC